MRVPGGYDRHACAVDTGHEHGGYVNILARLQFLPAEFRQGTGGSGRIPTLSTSGSRHGAARATRIYARLCLAARTACGGALH
jgi:hypothetical protein